MFDAKLAALEERLKSVPGKLPVAKTWQPESVTYQAEMVCHNGALYQARTVSRPVQRTGLVRSLAVPGGLHHHYLRASVFDAHSRLFVRMHEPRAALDPDWPLLHHGPQSNLPHSLRRIRRQGQTGFDRLPRPALVLRELAELRLKLARIEAFAVAPSPSASLH